MTAKRLTAHEIRVQIDENPKTRERDLAAKLGISEVELTAARGDAVLIDAHPDRVMAAAQTLGELMALTRNESCVHEKVGEYANYHSGERASMVLTRDIDLRIFPAHWCHAFAVEKQTESGVRRSIQIFDASGDAVHKIFLRAGSDLNAWEQAKADLALPPGDTLPKVGPRQPAEAPVSRPEKVDSLREEWKQMTDTHQFLRLCSKLKMNRLGAYRIVGEPFARGLDPSAGNQMLEAVRDTGIEFMFFVGNRGCIQIHTGAIGTLRPMGPWQNVMDPGFSTHLRRDHIAEVWAVEKPTRRGPAISVEAFDAAGGLIFQAFARSREDADSRPEWAKIVANLPPLKAEVA